ncbi:hypothetical protein Z948_767 [Sulfitobacter donghicola DSW-25 = KCTC 12864 = JCM 14565]|nr:surface lipoprotein assembly modifier [Sulfitobacter donghicola]KIN67062.1 hypothetical protein Z948_767 [Sulfitobacter donghicola DSW-25 = KCTC 12864 = JCM 14565]
MLKRSRNFGVALFLGAALVLNAAPIYAQPTLAELRAVLKRDPDNRQARWALSRMAYQAQHYEVARYHVMQLLKNSPSQADVNTLSRALAKINSEDPWRFRLSFALRPSDNIRRYTYNDRFETALGIFTPSGAGQEQSGIGSTIGASLSYRFNLENAAELTVIGRIDHSVFDSGDLNSTRLFLAARHERFSVGRKTIIEPFLRFRLDHDFALERRDVGLNAAVNLFHKGGHQLRFSSVIENRSYLDEDALSGPYGRLDLRYDRVLDVKTRLGVGLSVARSLPRGDHLKYWEGRLSIDASRHFDKIGTLGLFGRYTNRQYDGLFPATDLFRADGTIAVGVSYQPKHIKIFGARPKLTCQIERNASNVSLYDYKANDCGFTFHRSF